MHLKKRKSNPLRAIHVFGKKNIAEIYHKYSYIPVPVEMGKDKGFFSDALEKNKSTILQTI